MMRILCLFQKRGVTRILNLSHNDIVLANLFSSLVQDLKVESMVLILSDRWLTFVAIASVIFSK